VTLQIGLEQECNVRGFPLADANEFFEKKWLGNVQATPFLFSLTMIIF
jgi:hypothetical protein